MATYMLERNLEAQVLAEEGYGLMTAPWELIQTIRSHASEIRPPVSEGASRPGWHWHDQDNIRPPRAA